jgi:hypothetical protein
MAVGPWPGHSCRAGPTLRVFRLRDSGTFCFVDYELQRGGKPDVESISRMTTPLNKIGRGAGIYETNSRRIRSGSPQPSSKSLPCAGSAIGLAPRCAPRSSTGTASTTATKSAALSGALRANTPAEALADLAPLIAWATSACAACLWRLPGVFTSGIGAGTDFRSSIMFWDPEPKPERLPERKPLWPAHACSPSISGESNRGPVMSRDRLRAARPEGQRSREAE